MEDVAVVEQPHDRPSVAAWLKQQMTVGPSDRIRVAPQVLPDRRANPGADAGTEVLEAWGDGTWGYSRMAGGVYVALMPARRAARRTR